ncbi:MAG: DNA polymerase III subunit gamma and tau [Candidatus Nanopelagicales bacterium]|nr:DNA polymerase III subunit gamma and tau [Candidatus Nanopelagicales bacterium]
MPEKTQGVSPKGPSMALYRSYRPATLNGVVGQDHVTGPLRRALENNRIHHAYLLSGPRGCGKTSTARILARSINCELGPTPDPCGECESCIDLSATGSGSIDVIELDAASHGGVDDTRDLRERAMFGPAKSPYKVYIIDEAHMITPQGFNALLKLVEEPPEHVRFIFATTEADKVLPTIRSRTHNYGFRLVPMKILQEHLVMVCASEGIPADPAALALIARAGTGSVRDSLSILGQVISGCGPEGVTYQEAVLQLGVTDSALLDETVNALIDRDGAALFTAVDRVIESGNEPRRFVTDLLERVRDLIVLQRIPGAAESGLIHAPEEVIATEVDQASRIGPAELARAGDLVNRALGEIKGATAPRLQLELLMAKLLLPTTDDSTDGLRARLELLERSGVVNHVPARAQAKPVATEPSPRPAKPVAPRPAKPVAPVPPVPTSPVPTSPVPAPPVPTPPKKPAKPAAEEPVEDTPKPVATQALVPNLGNTTVASFISMWPAVMDALLKYSRVAWMGFTESTPLSFDNGVLAVGVKDSGHYNNVKSGGHHERLRQAILDVLKIDTEIDIVLGAKGVVGGAIVPPVPEEEDAPSMDDSASSEVTGADLIAKELGGVSIGEIENG